jgi:hypothetical protein
VEPIAQTTKYQMIVLLVVKELDKMRKEKFMEGSVENHENPSLSLSLSHPRFEPRTPRN